MDKETFQREYMIEPERRTGRTTRLALKALLWISENPGKTLMVVDHHDSRVTSAYLMDLIRSVADRLGMSQGLVVNAYRGTVCYKDNQ